MSQRVWGPTVGGLQSRATDLDLGTYYLWLGAHSLGPAILGLQLGAYSLGLPILDLKRTHWLGAYSLGSTVGDLQMGGLRSRATDCGSVQVLTRLRRNIEDP